MIPYTLALFAHILGAFGFLMSLGVWLFGIIAMRRASSVNQVRVICRAIFLSDPLAVGGILLLAAAGLYMAFTSWGLETGWVTVAIISFALMAPIGPLIVERRLHAIERVARQTPEGPLPAPLAAQIADPVMGTALQVLLALLLGIVSLMTVKPPLGGSALAMVLALLLGLASGIPLLLSAQRQGPQGKARA